MLKSVKSSRVPTTIGHLTKYWHRKNNSATTGSKFAQCTRGSAKKIEKWSVTKERKPSERVRSKLLVCVPLGVIKVDRAASMWANNAHFSESDRDALHSLREAPLFSLSLARPVSLHKKRREGSPVRAASRALGARISAPSFSPSRGTARLFAFSSVAGIRGESQLGFPPLRFSRARGSPARSARDRTRNAHWYPLPSEGWNNKRRNDNEDLSGDLNDINCTLE